MIKPLTPANLHVLPKVFNSKIILNEIIIQLQLFQNIHV